MFTLAILVLIIAGIAKVVSIFLPVQGSTDEDIKPKKIGQVTSRILVGLGVLFLVISSIAIVSTKNVGIETAFGSTTGHLSNGLHLIAPWDNVTEMDAAIQTDSHTGESCLDVRIANQQTACVDISIRWRIDPSQADSLYQNYRTFENVRDSLVTRELTAAVNNQLSGYNPLNTITLATATASNGNNPTFTQIATRVTDQMRREIGREGIVVLNTIIPIMHFDASTQARLNQIQTQYASTRVAQAQLQTNQAQALANAALAQSINNSPYVLVSKCYDIVQEMVKNGQTVPAGFSCWPGGGVAAVIAGSSTGK